MIEGQVLKTDTAWTSTNNNVCYYSSTDKEIRALSPGKATMTSSGGQVTITVSSSSGLIGTAAQPGYLHIDVAIKEANQRPISKGDIVVVARSQKGYHEGSRMAENGVTIGFVCSVTAL